MLAHVILYCLLNVIGISCCGKTFHHLLCNKSNIYCAWAAHMSLDVAPCNAQNLTYSKFQLLAGGTHRVGLLRAYTSPVEVVIGV